MSSLHNVVAAIAVACVGCSSPSENQGISADAGGLGSDASLGADAAILATDAEVAVCGDSNRDPSEGCDDGNRQSHDGCSADCDVETLSWRDFGPGGPPARLEAGMVFDSARGVSLLYGGFAREGDALRDTWEWDGANWRRRNPATSPPRRNTVSMAYDSRRRRTVLYGGSGLDDTWEFDGTNWNQIDVVGPPPRWGHAMAYDSSRGVVVLFGGTLGVSNVTDETWEYDGTAWTKVMTTSTPPSRRYHSMTYDSLRARIVMFGGVPRNGGRLADTWEFDGTDWVTIDAGAIIGRSKAVLEYHRVLGAVVLVGGSATEADEKTWALMDGTWTELSVRPQRIRRGSASAYDSARGQIVRFGGNALASIYGSQRTAHLGFR